MHVAQTAGTLPKDGASNFPIIGCSANMLAAPIAIVSDAIPTKAHEAGGACLSAPPLDAGEMPGSADEESILIATTFQEKVFASEGACSNSRDRGYLQKRHRLVFPKVSPLELSRPVRKVEFDERLSSSPSCIRCRRNSLQPRSFRVPLIVAPSLFTVGYTGPAARGSTVSVR